MSFSPTSGATIRADLNTVVEEAASADKFFIGLKAMPDFGVDAKSGSYPKIQIAAGGLMDNIATERTGTGTYGRVSRQWTADTYDCVDRGLEEIVGDTDAKDASRFFNMEASAAKLTLRSVMLAHEIRVATALMNVSTFATPINDSTAYTVANLSTLPFVADLLAAIERVRDNGHNPNTVIMSSAVYNRVRQGTLTTNFVAGQIGKGASVTATTLAQAFADEGIEQVLVGRARYNSAKKGATFSAASVWGNTYIWVGVCNQSAGTMQDGGAGFTLRWNAEGGIWVTESYRDEERRSNVVRVRQNTTEKIVDATAGVLIQTDYA